MVKKQKMFSILPWKRTPIIIQMIAGHWQTIWAVGVCFYLTTLNQTKGNWELKKEPSPIFNIDICICINTSLWVFVLLKMWRRQVVSPSWAPMCCPLRMVGGGGGCGSTPYSVVAERDNNSPPPDWTRADSSATVGDMHSRKHCTAEHSDLHLSHWGAFCLSESAYWLACVVCLWMKYLYAH